MNITDRLTALAAEPKNWRVTSTFSDGKVRIHDQPRQSMAEGYAAGQRRYLAKVVKVIDGVKITLDSVTVTYLTNGAA